MSDWLLHTFVPAGTSVPTAALNLAALVVLVVLSLVAGLVAARGVAWISARGHRAPRITVIRNAQGE